MSSSRAHQFDPLLNWLNEFRRSIGPRHGVLWGDSEPDPRVGGYKAAVVQIPDFERAKHWCLQHGLTDSSDSRKVKNRMLRMLRRRLKRQPDSVPIGIARFRVTDFW